MVHVSRYRCESNAQVVSAVMLTSVLPVHKRIVGGGDGAGGSLG